MVKVPATKNDSKSSRTCCFCPVPRCLHHPFPSVFFSEASAKTAFMASDLLRWGWPSFVLHLLLTWGIHMVVTLQVMQD